MAGVISFFKKRNGEQSFEALIYPHMDMLLRQAYHYLGNNADAEDLVQDLLTELYGKQDKLRQAKSTKAWLMRCLYHRFVDGYRKRQQLPLIPDGETEIELQLAPSSSGPDDAYWHQQILTHMQQLSAEQRSVISLHDIEGHSLLDIAESLDMPLGTLKSHLHRGRKKLKELLKLQPSSAQNRQYQ